MSLTGKLILGFAFALLLQVTQVVIGNVFTARLQAASEQVADSLAANLAVQGGLEAVAQLRDRVALYARQPLTTDVKVLRVYTDELGSRDDALRTALADDYPQAARGIEAKRTAICQQLDQLGGNTTGRTAEAVADDLAFLDDNAHELEQELRRCQVALRGLAKSGVLREQQVRELPMKASLAIAGIGVLVLAAFVAWFSPQLVLPVERARAELERRVAERTRELASTVTQLEDQIQERHRVERQKDELNQKLVEASHRAGMAELANGVLHNVGNVLNSVNVSADLMRQQLQNSRLGGVGRVAALLKSHADDLGEFLCASPQGRALPTYLDQLGTHLNGEKAQLVAELANLWSRIDHMKEIVDRQQSYARCAGVTAAVRPRALVEEVFAMLRSTLERAAVRTSIEVDGDDECELDRSRVVQILVNLVRNAAHAVGEARPGGGQVTVTVDRDGDRIRFRVRDDGVGIATEDLERIFAHGFTTKREGHGFGLHHSANAATEMGGRLSAESAGRGHGATFVLELPMRVPGAAIA